MWWLKWILTKFIFERNKSINDAFSACDLLSIFSLHIFSCVTFHLKTFEGISLLVYWIEKKNGSKSQLDNLTKREYFSGTKEIFSVPLRNADSYRNEDIFSTLEILIWAITMRVSCLQKEFQIKSYQ